MTITEPSFTIGLEEEYLLVDKETRDLSNERAEAVLAACQKEIGDQVGPEFLTSQIEIGTSVCSNVAELRDELIRLRRAARLFISPRGQSGCAGRRAGRSRRAHPWTASTRGN